MGTRVVGSGRLVPGRRSRRRAQGTTPYGNGAWQPVHGLFGTMARESTYARGSMRNGFEDANGRYFCTSTGPQIAKAVISNRPVGVPAQNRYNPKWSGILRIDASGNVQRVITYPANVIAVGGVEAGFRYDEDQWAFAGRVADGAPYNPHAYRAGPPMPRLVDGNLHFFKTYGGYELDRDSESVITVSGGSINSFSVNSLAGGRTLSSADVGEKIWSADTYPSLPGIGGFNSEFQIHSLDENFEFSPADVGRLCVINGQVYTIGAVFRFDNIHYYDATVDRPIEPAQVTTVTNVGGSLHTGDAIHNVQEIGGATWRVLCTADGLSTYLMRDGTIVDSVTGLGWPATSSEVLLHDGRVYWATVLYDQDTGEDVDRIASFTLSGGGRRVERNFRGQQLSSSGTGTAMIGGALISHGRNIVGTSTGVLGYKDGKTGKWVPETIDHEGNWNDLDDPDNEERELYNEFGPVGPRYFGGDPYLEFHNFRHELLLPVGDRLFSLVWYIGAPDGINQYAEDFYDDGRLPPGDVTTTNTTFPDRQMIMAWSGGSPLGTLPAPARQSFDPV